MSMIINKETKSYEEQSHRRYPDNWNGSGWIPVPIRLEPRARAYCPYCNLVIENNTLIDITPTQKPEPSPDYDSQISALKQQLSSEDYKIIKCSEAQLAGEPLPYDIQELHNSRNAIREQINSLEEQKASSENA